MKEEIKSKITLVICVLVIIIGTYLITALFMTKEIGGGKKASSDNTTNSNAGLSLNYKNLILAGDTFNINSDKYMVLFFSEKDTHDYVKSAFNSYDSKESDIKLYKVNIDEAINKYVKSSENNSAATNDKELKIKGDTLITIVDKKITSYIDDEDAILEALR